MPWQGVKEFSEAGSPGSTRWKKEISEASLTGGEGGCFTGLVPCCGGSSLLMLPGHAASLLKLLFLIWLHPVLVVEYALLAVACAAQFPDHIRNPGPLHWDSRGLAAGPPAKSSGQILVFLWWFFPRRRGCKFWNMLIYLIEKGRTPPRISYRTYLVGTGSS